MRWVQVLVLALLAVVLQVSLLPSLDVRFVRPDLVMTVVVALALARGGMDGMVYGVVGGLLADATLGRHLGLDALCYWLAGAAIGRIARTLVHDRVVTPFLFALMAELGKQLLSWIILVAMGADLEGRLGSQVGWGTALATAIAAPLVYAFIDRVYPRPAGYARR